MNTDGHGCKKVEGRAVFAALRRAKESKDEGALTPSLSHPMGEGGRRPGEGAFGRGCGLAALGLSVCIRGYAHFLI
ncbi:MAG TPA: hypothetical protein VFD66_13590 [Verrucomicrobiae bacterium]|nr:hypothetical protein [Verrucomicrobiae bacterium]